MMTFIKNDIVVFGVGVLLFIIATLWFVDRDVEAKRVDKKKKDTSKEAPKTEENKQATA